MRNAINPASKALAATDPQEQPLPNALTRNGYMRLTPLLKRWLMGGRREPHLTPTARVE